MPRKLGQHLKIDRPRKLLSKTPTLAEVVDFDSLRRHLGVRREDWEAFIICDGSGSSIDRPCGWGSVLIEKGRLGAEVFAGGLSHGTVNMAEVLGVLHPLMMLVDRKAGARAGGCRTHVVSDSKYVVDGLSHANPVWATETKHWRGLWMGIHMCRRQGLIIVPHHVPRDVIEVQRSCDSVSKLARKAVTGLTAPWIETVTKEANL